MLRFDIGALRDRLRLWLSSSISNRITFAALSLTMAVALVIGGTSYAVVTVLVHRSIKAELETQARLTMQKLEADLNGVAADLAGMAANSFIANGLVDSLGRDTYLLPFLHEHHASTSGKRAIILCDFQGRPIASNLSAIPSIDVARTGIEKVLEAGKPYSEVRHTKDAATLVLVHPVIFPPTGQTEGVLVELADFQDLFASGTGHLDEGHLATLFADGEPVARSAREAATTDMISVQYRLRLAAPLQSLNLVFQVGESRSTAYGPLRWVGLAYLVLGTLTLILALKFSRATARRLTTPLTTLSLAAARISEGGSWNLSTEVSGDDEVAKLARAFRQMLQRLRAAREYLEAQVHERTSELKEAHDRLEERVAQRTSELIEANLRLEREILTSSQLELQLRQVQKMEAIGTLAGGIAHDFNNILTVIGSYSIMTQHSMPDDDPRRENLDHIVEATERAAHLTRSLLAFSRKQVMDPRPTDLNHIVSNVEKFLLRVIGEDIHLSTVRRAALPVHADSGQIEQVLMNLATNARDAMPKGGTLTIETALEFIDDAYVSAHCYPQTPGQYAVVTVTDTGCGMDEETQRKIFEPFYTTKEVGKGTGLGLAMVYGIVKQHNGYITVHSKPGEGTTFRIFMPVLEQARGDLPVKAAPTPPHRGGTETVLVAEDDAEIRTVVASLLANAGYQVITAKDGQEAVELFARHRSEIGLVLMDIVMPKKSGKDAHQAMRQVDPAVRVLFSSGYTADFIKSRGELEEGAQLIMKPVHPAVLLAKVREMLDAP